MNIRNAILLATAAFALNFAVPATAEARDHHRHYRHHGRHHDHGYRHYPRYRPSRGYYYYESRPRVIYSEPRYYYDDYHPRPRYYARPHGVISFHFGGSHW